LLNLPADRARALCLTSFQQLGFDQAEAADCTNAIMFATLRGLDSHGIISILPGLARRVANGAIRPGARLVTLRESPVTAVYRGNGVAGPVVGTAAMRAAIARARQHGVGLSAVAHADHFGAASVYAAMAADEGMIGLVVCNALAVVAPFGGAEPLHGTNPLAYAAPSGGEFPIVLDIATSAAAHGQIFKAQRRGQPIPPGWALDRDGRPTTDADAEGVLLPFGGHKGYGIGILVDLLSGALTGSTIGRGVRQGATGPEGGQAMYFQAIDVSFFTEPDTFRARVDQLVGEAKAIRPAEGFDEVLLPGELEWRQQQRRLREGIPLEEADWQAISSGLEQAGLPPEVAAAHAPDGSC
jgi:LDH2 family malate/lactate/ureidoglycolate dehydrogenase